MNYQEHRMLTDRLRELRAHQKHQSTPEYQELPDGAEILANTIKEIATLEALLAK